MRRNNPDKIQYLLLIFNFGHRILIWTLFLKKEQKNVDKLISRSQNITELMNLQFLSIINSRIGENFWLV